MTERARIVLVGGGVAGLSTAWHLARAGERGVVLLERNEYLGAESTAKNAAILRTLTGDPVSTELGRAGARFLRAPPPGFADVPLVDACGLVLVASSDEAAGELAGWAARARMPVRRLGAAELAELAPHYRPGGARAALQLADEGRIDVAALVAGFERGARAGGVSIRTEAPVERILVDGARVAGVRLAGGERIEAERVVVGAGGWAGALGAAAGSRIALRPTRRHLLVTAEEEEIDPRWPVVWTLDDPFYARPESGGLLLCACDEDEVDPDRCTWESEMRGLILEKAARYLARPGRLRPRHLWSGMRTFADDRRFVIGPDPDVEGLHWAAGLGGHGMVCAAEVGRIAARRLAGGEPLDPLERAVDPRRLAPRAAGYSRSGT